MKINKLFRSAEDEEQKLKFEIYFRQTIGIDCMTIGKERKTSRNDNYFSVRLILLQDFLSGIQNLSLRPFPNIVLLIITS
jgi:hypothetical protein